MIKPGSLIEYMSGAFTLLQTQVIIQLPQKDKIYTCKLIGQHMGIDYLCIEEFSFGYDTVDMHELMMDASLWREVIIPPAMEEQIQEALTQQLV